MGQKRKASPYRSVLFDVGKATNKSHDILVAILSWIGSIGFLGVIWYFGTTKLFPGWAYTPVFAASAAIFAFLFYRQAVVYKKQLDAIDDAEGSKPPPEPKLRVHYYGSNPGIVAVHSYPNQDNAKNWVAPIMLKCNTDNNVQYPNVIIESVDGEKMEIMIPLIGSLKGSSKSYGEKYITPADRYEYVLLEWFQDGRIRIQGKKDGAFLQKRVSRGAPDIIQKMKIRTKCPDETQTATAEFEFGWTKDTIRKPYIRLIKSNPTASMDPYSFPSAS